MNKKNCDGFELLVNGCSTIVCVWCVVTAVGALLTGPSGWALVSSLALLMLGWECGWEFIRRLIDTWKELMSCRKEEIKPFEIIEPDDAE